MHTIVKCHSVFLASAWVYSHSNEHLKWVTDENSMWVIWNMVMSGLARSGSTAPKWIDKDLSVSPFCRMFIFYVKLCSTKFTKFTKLPWCSLRVSCWCTTTQTRKHAGGKMCMTFTARGGIKWYPAHASCLCLPVYNTGNLRSLGIQLLWGFSKQNYPTLIKCKHGQWAEHN